MFKRILIISLILLTEPSWSAPSIGERVFMRMVDTTMACMRISAFKMLKTGNRIQSQIMAFELQECHRPMMRWAWKEYGENGAKEMVLVLIYMAHEQYTKVQGELVGVCDSCQVYD